MADEESRRVLLDTNVFVAAVKDPLRSTASYRLIVQLLQRDDVRLIGNDILALEYLRYAEAFPSPTAASLATAIAQKMEIVRVEERFLRACAPFFRQDQVADTVHAATCLQTGAVLVTNDRDFDRIARSGMVTRWKAAEAIRRWLK